MFTLENKDCGKNQNQRYIPESEMYSWYYVWSDLYRLFHEVVQHGIQDVSGVAVKPIHMPQHIFNRKTDDVSRHFLTGIAIKIHCIVKILKETTEPYIVFSDADLIVQDKNLVAKLVEYEKNDITAMAENHERTEYNIGFMLIKKTPETIAFFERVLKRVFEERKLDQDIFNEEIKSFSGKHGFFDTKYFIQSSMVRKDIWDVGNYSIIQCLSSEHNSMKNVILGKLATLVYFYDIRNLIHFVDQDTIKEFQEYMKLTNPTHYMCALDLKSCYETKEDSTTEQLPKNP